MAWTFPTSINPTCIVSSPHHEHARRPVPWKRNITLPITVVDKNLPQRIEIKIISITKTMAVDFSLAQISCKPHQETSSWFLDRRIFAFEIFRKRLHAISGQQIPPAIWPLANSVSVMLTTCLDFENPNRRTISHSILIGVGKLQQCTIARTKHVISIKR